MNDEKNNPLSIDVKAFAAGLTALGAWLDKHGPAAVFGFQRAQDFADQLTDTLNAFGEDLPVSDQHNIDYSPTVEAGSETEAKFYVDSGATLIIRAADGYPEETLKRDPDGSYIRRWESSARVKEAGQMNHGMDFAQAFRFLYSDRWPTIHVVHPSDEDIPPRFLYATQKEAALYYLDRALNALVETHQDSDDLWRARAIVADGENARALIDKVPEQIRQDEIAWMKEHYPDSPMPPHLRERPYVAGIDVGNKDSTAVVVGKVDPDTGKLHIYFEATGRRLNISDISRHVMEELRLYRAQDWPHIPPVKPDEPGI